MQDNISEKLIGHSVLSLILYFIFLHICTMTYTDWGDCNKNGFIWFCTYASVELTFITNIQI